MAVTPTCGLALPARCRSCVSQAVLCMWSLSIWGVVDSCGEYIEHISVLGSVGSTGNGKILPS